jgi:UDP-N-acetyl-D-mannosaminuronic acid dehydrogenase
MKLPYEKVCVIGLGYIGLPTAAILASRGVKVVGVDVNPKAVESVNQGKIHIVEPELGAVVHSTVMNGKLSASYKPESAEVFIIAVPTPFKENHKPDLSFIEAAAQSIAPVLRKGNLVILESTSPVGTTEKLANWLAEKRPDLSFPHQKGNESDIRVAYCPERVLPGHILREIVENDRIIGGLSRRCSESAKALYQTFVKGECLVTHARTAEMTKLTENAFRDVNIAFANELSLICDHLDINVWELIKLSNRHPRVNILQPGPGVGGHCLAVDPWFIVDSAPEQSRMIKTAREVNDNKPSHILAKIRDRVAGRKHPTIACLGLSFKADIDDLRESPAMEIVQRLAEQKHGTVLVVEPHIEELPKKLDFPHVKIVEMEEALKLADVIVVLVNHRGFLNIDPKLIEGKTVIDTRGVWQ